MTATPSSSIADIASRWVSEVEAIELTALADNDERTILTWGCRGDFVTLEVTMESASTARKIHAPVLAAHFDRLE